MSPTSPKGPLPAVTKRGLLIGLAGVAGIVACATAAGVLGSRS